MAATPCAGATVAAWRRLRSSSSKEAAHCRRQPSAAQCSGFAAAPAAAAHAFHPSPAAPHAAARVRRLALPRAAVAAAAAASAPAARNYDCLLASAALPRREMGVQRLHPKTAACRCLFAAGPPPSPRYPAFCVLRAAAVSPAAGALASAGAAAAAAPAATCTSRNTASLAVPLITAAAAGAVGRCGSHPTPVAAARKAVGRTSNRLAYTAAAGSAKLRRISCSSCCYRLINAARSHADIHSDGAAAAEATNTVALGRATASHMCNTAAAVGHGVAAAATAAAAAALHLGQASCRCREVLRQQRAAVIRGINCCWPCTPQLLQLLQRGEAYSRTWFGLQHQPDTQRSLYGGDLRCQQLELLPHTSRKTSPSCCCCVCCGRPLLFPSPEKSASGIARPLWLLREANLGVQQFFKRVSSSSSSSRLQQQLMMQRDTGSSSSSRSGGSSRSSSWWEKLCHRSIQEEQPMRRRGVSCSSSSGAAQQELQQEQLQRSTPMQCHSTTSPQHLLLLQQKRSFASLSKAGQHKKRMRKILEKRRHWKLPHVPKHYLRAEADFSVLSIQRPAASLSQWRREARARPPPAASLIDISAEDEEKEGEEKEVNKRGEMQQKRGEREGEEKARHSSVTVLHSRGHEGGLFVQQAQKHLQQQQHEHAHALLQQQQQQRRLLKPHEVARLLQREPPAGGTTDDKADPAELTHRRGSLPRLSSTVVKPLHLEDLPHYASRVEAGEIKVPQPPPSASSSSRNGSTKEELDFAKLRKGGTHAEDDVNYYRRYFKDRYRRLDGREKEVQELLKKREEEDARLRIRKRLYIPPKQYWYRDDYESPLPSEVLQMKSFRLKFALMNEARVVKAGWRPLDLSLWRAFEARLLQLASHRSHVRAATLLRGLHAISKIQHAALPETLDGIIRGLMYREPTLKPQHYVFLLQALARLRYRHVYVLHALKEMMVSWPVLRNNFLLKAANALAKLGLASHILCKPLQVTLAMRISGFTASNCCRVKWITAIDLFSGPMLLSFLRRCQQQEHAFRHYSQNLQVMELYIRMQQPELYLQLPPLVQYFLERLRVAHTEDAEEEEGDGEIGEEEEDLDSLDDSDDWGEQQHAEEFFFSERPSSSAAAARLSIASFAPPASAAAAADAVEGETTAETSAAAAAAGTSRKEETSACVIEEAMAAEEELQKQQQTESRDSTRVFSDYKTKLSANSMEESSVDVAHSACKEEKYHQGARQTPERQEGNVERDDRQVPGEREKEGDTEEAEEDKEKEEKELGYTSALHADVSRLLRLMGVQHFNSVRAGPFRVDMYHPSSNTVIETCPAFQFYSNSVDFTALSKRRHQLLASMGFQLVLLPYQRWEGLRNDEEKQQLLRRTLPPEIFSQAQQLLVPSSRNVAALS